MILSGAAAAEPDARGGSRLGAACDIIVVAGTIVSVEPHRPERGGGHVVDLRGTLVTPGLINGHTHSHEALHRGRYEKLPLEVWMHYVRPPFPTRPLDARTVYLRTMAVALEALGSGATAIVDDVNLLPWLRDDHIEAVFTAYRDAGIRAFVGLSLIDLPFHASVPWVDDELPGDIRARMSADLPPGDELLQLTRDLVNRFPASARVSAIVAPSAPQRCSDAFLHEALTFAREAGVPAITHVHETRLQAVTAQLRYGRTMIEQLDVLGLLSPGLTLIHGAWLRPDDCERLAANGTSVQHNPTSNLRLGSGIAPVRAMLDAGVNVSLGTDGCSSCAASGMLAAVRDAALIHSLRGADPSGWITTREAFSMGTDRAARALLAGDRLGQIAPGYRADLTFYRTDGVAMTPLADPLAQLVHGAGAAALHTTVVDGEVVYRNGQPCRVDQAALLRELREAHFLLLPELERIDSLVDELQPTYARILRRALAHPIPHDTIEARLADQDR